MAELTKENPRQVKHTGFPNVRGVYANTKIFNGALVAVHPTGYITNASDTAGLRVCGVSYETKDNTGGASGDLYISYGIDNIHEFSCSGATAAWLHQKLYVTDNDNVQLTANTNGIIAGECIKVLSATKVEVRVSAVISDLYALYAPSDGVLNIPTTALRNAAGGSLGVVQAADVFNIKVGTNIETIESEIALSETETSAMRFDMTLPADYLSGGAVTLRLKSKLFGAGTNNGSTLDAEVFPQDAGALGSDLCTTAAQALTTSWADYDYTITPTGLVAGDRFSAVVTGSIIESAGSNLQAEIDGIQLVYKRVAK
jgi:hypothetical protein